MNRRDFLGAFAALVLVSRYWVARCKRPSSLTIGDVVTNPVTKDFVGLSYESAQLANPDFFSAKNEQLVGLFRELAPHGNLRLGGGSSEFTTYSEEAPAGPPPFEVFGPDTSKTVKHGTVTSALALRNLRSFLEATNWNCLYGLNLGQGALRMPRVRLRPCRRFLDPAWSPFRSAMSRTAFAIDIDLPVIRRPITSPSGTGFAKRL